MAVPGRWVGPLGICGIGLLGLAFGGAWRGRASDADPEPQAAPPALSTVNVEADSRLQVDGVFPQLSVPATGIGALLPWADRLWAVACGRTGNAAAPEPPGDRSGGLYEIDSHFNVHQHQGQVAGGHTNRLIHAESAQAFLGPFVVDAQRNVRAIPGLIGHSIAATARHLSEPDRLVYHLTIDGQLFETDVHTLETKALFDLNETLRMPSSARPNFRAACTAQGRLVVACDTFGAPEFLGKRSGGRLAQFDGKSWSVVQEDPFIDVATTQEAGAAPDESAPLYAIGWDKASAILRVLQDGTWRRYRLPKGGGGWDRGGGSLGMRIRPIQAGRVLLDAAGLYYELPESMPGGNLWGVVPLARHLRSSPDLTTWRGLMVLAGEPPLSAVGSAAASPQSNLWFVPIERLWTGGKPQGWGALWWDDPVDKKSVSDPFLMTGFDQKVLHLRHDGDDVATFTLEVDFLGDGSWNTYASIQVFPNVYAHHEFPPGYAAHWIRLRCDTPGKATAALAYH